MSELCIRCGRDGEDRRTLWHACFYEMSEFAVPFQTATLFHADITDLTPSKAPFQFTPENGPPITLEAGRVRSTGELIPHKLYTLRVCKRCRGDWLRAIETWFAAEPTKDWDESDEDADND